MSKTKQIDATARRMGAMLRRARHMCQMSMDETALMLRIMPDELVTYERGVQEIPLHIMEHIFIMGYKMMQVRIIEGKYRQQRKFCQKVNQVDTCVK